MRERVRSSNCGSSEALPSKKPPRRSRSREIRSNATGGWRSCGCCANCGVASAMSSDRWRQVEDLCHAALARRADERRPFLVKACEGDEALLREVESLLAQESSAEAFMRVPAAALAGSAGLDQPAAALVGAGFGSYN